MRITSLLITAAVCAIATLESGSACAAAQAVHMRVHALAAAGTNITTSGGSTAAGGCSQSCSPLSEAHRGAVTHMCAWEAVSSSSKFDVYFRLANRYYAKKCGCSDVTDGGVLLHHVEKNGNVCYSNSTTDTFEEIAKQVSGSAQC